MDEEDGECTYIQNDFCSLDDMGPSTLASLKILTEESVCTTRAQRAIAY